MALSATPGWGATLAVLSVLALAPAAAADSLVPPGNSAVNQYTESYPTAAGDRDVRNRDGGNRTPAQVLGPRKARRLAAQGAAGRAAAALTAATAPVPGEAGPAAAGGSGTRDGAAPPDGPTAPGGSSGLGEVLGQATGLSSPGGASALLPLAILATALWSLAYLWRRKHPAARQRGQRRSTSLPR